MTLDEIIKFIQELFTDGLVLVIGSGLSAAEGMPGMPELATHLLSEGSRLTGKDADLWSKIAGALNAGNGLESALLKHAPSTSLESWITKQTCELLIPRERKIIGEVVGGMRTLRLTSLLTKVLKPPTGIPILTPNYDRLIEVGCEMAGFHVDTTAIGEYAGAFDHTRSFMASCRGIVSRGRGVTVLDHFPRAVVLKPHGSFDWYTNGATPIRCSVDLAVDRLMITPGLNKYKAGYNAPFDKHRELANDHINRAARLLVVGYGFNDDHLQTHLITRIQTGTPTLILTREISKPVRKLADQSPNCICLGCPSARPGVTAVSKKKRIEVAGRDLWDLGILAKELLA